jgi:hypothetical protein
MNIKFNTKIKFNIMNRCFYFENGDRCLNIISIDKKYCNICLKKPQYLDLIFKLCESDKIKLTNLNLRSILCNPHFDFRDLHKLSKILPHLQQSLNFDLKDIIKGNLLLKDIFETHYFTNSELLYFLQYLNYDYSQTYHLHFYNPLTFGLKYGFSKNIEIKQIVHNGDGDFMESLTDILKNLSLDLPNQSVKLTYMKDIHYYLQYLNYNSNYTLNDLKQICLLTNNHFIIDYTLFSSNKNVSLQFVLSHLEYNWNYITVLNKCILDCDLNFEILEKLADKIMNSQFSNFIPNFIPSHLDIPNKEWFIDSVLSGIWGNRNLNYDYLFKHKNLFVKFFESQSSSIFNNTNLSINNLENLGVVFTNTDYTYMLNNPNITISDITKYNLTPHNINYDTFTKYKYLNISEVYKYIYNKFDYIDFSAYRGLSIDYIKQNSQLLYNILSKNPSFSISEIYNNLNLPWNSNSLLENKFQYIEIPKYKINIFIEFQFEKMYELSEILENLVPEELISILVQYL